MSASVLLALLLAAAADPGDLAWGRAATGHLLGGDPSALAGGMTPEMLGVVGGREGLVRFGAEVERVAGEEVALLREATYRQDGLLYYYRESRFEKAPKVTLSWVFAPDGRISGARIGPSTEPAATPHEGYRTRAELRLPFGRVDGGGWYVTWGGRDPISNYHVIAADQRFATDFVTVRDGSDHVRDGGRNEDHHCWDRPVLAPAAGRVVRAVGNQPDNPRPGLKTQGVTPPGNHVVIDHGRGERSLIAHFRAGSLAVREGQRVAAGALLGRCGNSGNSSKPHVHYHLQTGDAFGEGLGLPAFFNGYEADGALVGRGEPQRGQVVNPAD
jgi:hypothetical protein